MRFTLEKSCKCRTLLASCYCAHSILSTQTFSTQDIYECIFSTLFDPKNPDQEFALYQRCILEGANVIMEELDEVLEDQAYTATETYGAQHTINHLLQMIEREAKVPRADSIMAVSTLVQVLQVCGLHRGFVARGVYTALVQYVWKWFHDEATSEPYEVGYALVAQVSICVSLYVIYAVDSPAS